MHKSIFGAICLVGISFNINANLITNGDFETGDYSGWTKFNDYRASTGGAIITAFDTNSEMGNSYAARFEVGWGSSYYPSEPRGGGIYQSFSTDGGLFDVNLDIASYQSRTDATNGSGGLFSLLIDDILIDTYDFNFMEASEIKRSSLSGLVDLDAGEHEIRILVQRKAQSRSLTPYQYIDNISVVSAVPIPAAAWLFGSGLLGLVTVARRNKTTVTS